MRSTFDGLWGGARGGERGDGAVGALALVVGGTDAQAVGGVLVQADHLKRLVRPAIHLVEPAEHMRW